MTDEHRNEAKIVLEALERHVYDHLREPSTDREREHKAVLQAQIADLTKMVHAPEVQAFDPFPEAEQPVIEAEVPVQTQS